MELAIRDQQIHQLKSELEHRKQLLCSKRTLLKTNMKENMFLKEVAKDYDNYNNYIINQKQHQIASLEILNKYIENITLDLNLTNNKLKESHQEQRDILKEINILKNDIDNLV